MSKWDKDPRHLTTMPENGNVQDDGTIRSVAEVAAELSKSHGTPVIVIPGATDSEGKLLTEFDGSRPVGGYVTIRKP